MNAKFSTFNEEFPLDFAFVLLVREYWTQGNWLEGDNRNNM